MVSRPARRKEPEPATIVREYGPFPEVANVAGVTFDGQAVWFGAGARIQSFDPETGELGRALPLPADAGTAFDGKHLFQIGDGEIRKVDPETGQVLSTLPVPGGASGSSGLVWAEGTLWVGQAGARSIKQIDPETGRVLRTIESDRFVTGVTFLEGELWHGTGRGDADEPAELRRIDSETGEVLEQLLMPPGEAISGIESDGRDTLFCGSGRSGKVRAVRRPR